MLIISMNARLWECQENQGCFFTTINELSYVKKVAQSKK